MIKTSRERPKKVPECKIELEKIKKNANSQFHLAILSNFLDFLFSNIIIYMHLEYLHESFQTHVNSCTLIFDNILFRTFNYFK